MCIKISAIICTLNRADYLKKAIQSLIDQTLSKEHYEIIVVDNGSTDSTKGIIKSFECLENFRFILEPIMGLSQARNTGWQNANGKYIAYLDDDAIASSEWLERIVKAFENVKPQPGSVGGKVIPIWEVNRPAWLPKELERSLTIIDWTDKPTFLIKDSHYLAGTNVAYIREILWECGGFSTRLGRKGNKLLSSEEIMIKMYLKRHNLGSYYDPKICVQHHIPAERLKKRWFYRRSFWQGISSEILQYLEIKQNGVKWRYLYQAMANISYLIRSPKKLILILIPVDSNNLVLKKSSLFSSFGRICAQLQIGFGIVRSS